MFSPEQADILDRLQLIPYYPKDHHHIVLEEIYEFARGAPNENLRWLARTAVASMKQWAGLPELRGLWCSKYKPADGIEADCNLPGHTPAEIEAENPHIQSPPQISTQDRRLIEGLRETPEEARLRSERSDQLWRAQQRSECLEDARREFERKQQRKKGKDDYPDAPEWLKNLV